MKEYHEALQAVAVPVDRFFKKAFDNVVLNRPSVDFASLNGSPIMITSTHRSQTDYFLIGNILHRMGIKNLRFAAGDNLTNLPIIGKRFKSWGAFPVERHRSKNRKYILNLCDQVSKMLEYGDNVIVFPEMGRSYSGKMLEMKQVIIGAAVLAQVRNPEKRYLYLPTSICYEKLPELNQFDTLLAGKSMRTPDNNYFKRQLGNFLYFGADGIAFSKFLFGHRFGIKYGRVFVDVGEPVAINDIVDLKALHNPKASNDFWANRSAMQMISQIIFDRVLKLYRLLPAHLVSYIIKDHRAVYRSAIKDQISSVMDMLREQKRNVKTLDPLTEDQILDEGLQVLDNMKALNFKNSQIIIRKQSVIDYYAASIEVD